MIDLTPLAPRRIAALLLLAVPLAGCSDPLAIFAPSPEIYRLDPNLEAAARQESVPWQLVVELPLTSGALDNSRVPVTGDDLLVDYLAGVTWADRIPNMLQSILVRGFEEYGGISTVGPDVGGLRGDFTLKTALHDFQAQFPGEGYEGDPQVTVAMTVKLVRMPRRDIVASRAFRTQTPVAADGEDGRPSARSMVEGFNRAVADIVPEIVDWTLAEANQF